MLLKEIKHLIHKEEKVRQKEDKTVNPQGEDVILDRGIKHTLEGAGISDSLVTREQVGGLANRAKEWNFVSLHINTITTMVALGAIPFCVGMLLYCSSQDCWQSIWRAITCCRCTMGPEHHPPTYKSAMSTVSSPPVVTTMASAPTPGELENLEQAKYQKLAKQKRKQPMVKPDKNADSNEGEQKCG